MKLNDDYTATMKKIIQVQKQYEAGQKAADAATSKTNSALAATANRAASTTTGVSSLVARLSALVGVTYLAKKGLDAMFSAVKTSALQKVHESTFQALLNSEKAGTALYSYVSAYAKQSILGREDIAKGMTTFLTYSRDMNQLERMVKMTERLYAKDPTQGTEGAVFALKEILSGDTLSMRNRFNITGFDGASIRAKMAAGNTAGALDEIDAVLNRFGATQEVLDKNFKGLISQVELFRSNVKTAIGEDSNGAMENLAATVRRLNENFDSGKYQPFINMLTNGFNAAGNAIAWAADNATTLIPVLGGVVMAISAYNIATGIAAMVTTAMSIAMTPAVYGFIAIGAVILGVATALGIASGAMDGMTQKFNSVAGIAKSLEQSKSAAASAMTPLPTEITNADPISVKGSVEIKEENIKAMMDVAGMKFFAQYSNITPQLVVQNANFNNNTDMNDLMGVLGEFLESARVAQPEGLPA
ncbi:hypothetical protein DSECCO2_552000 [anaerobic digester metagenome]